MKKFRSTTSKGTEVIFDLRRNYKFFAIFTHPKVGEVKFWIDGWDSKEGPGIFGIADIGKTRQRVVLIIPESDWLKMEKTADETKKADIEKAMNLDIIGFKYEMGCDRPSTWRIIYDENELSSDIMDKREEADKPLVEAIRKTDIGKIAKETGAEPLESTLGSYGGWLFGRKQWPALQQAAEIELEKIEAERLKKERKRAEAKARKDAERQKAFDEEIMFFGPEPLASAGNSLLHSIAGSSDGKTIGVYDTIYKKIIPKPTGTYDIKENLSASGFEWNKQEKRWEIPHTAENVSLVTSLLREHATKADPVKLGLGKCWECGRWCYPSELNSDGYCGC